MLFKKHVNLFLCLVVCFSLVANIVFAGSDLDRALSPGVPSANNNSQNYMQYNDSNFIRNKIMPLIYEKWPNATVALNNFASSCKEDEDFIIRQWRP